MWDDLETPVKPHFYILDASGKPRPPYQSTEVNAIENAKALAAAEPGIEFVVYKAVHVVLAEPREPEVKAIAAVTEPVEE